MNEFYESILNIKKCSRDIVMKKINEIIIEELNDVTTYVNNMEGLCKVLSNNIKCRLDNENIRNFKVNIKNLGAVTDYEFLIASFFMTVFSFKNSSCFVFKVIESLSEFKKLLSSDKLILQFFIFFWFLMPALKE